LAQLQQYSVTQTGKKNIPNCPTFTIAGLVYNDAGVQVANFTGGAALEFPAVLATFTEAQVLALTDMLAHWVILTKAGLTV
jgi:hypothetical protein